jgi:hypothetical protein
MANKISQERLNAPEYEHVEELDQDHATYCPKCGELVQEAEDFDFEYIDGESVEFTCPCGTVLAINVQRPILKQLYLKK